MMNCSVNKSVSGDTASGPEPSLADAALGGCALANRLRRIAAAYCDGDGGCHTIDHLDRVHATALRIGRAMDGRLDILSSAAILHDIGRRDESESRGRLCHASRGAELAEKILRDLGCKPDDIAAIRHCIATHRYRDNNPPLSLEAKILFDADKLDSIGAVGIGRAFLFAGQIGARLHNRESDLASSAPYTVEDTAYREFRFKLCKIKERMQTPLGRQMAAERDRFMKSFFNRLEIEIHGGSPDVQGS